jgi:hypothetical protein
VAVEDGPAVLDPVGQSTGGDRVPSLGLGQKVNAPINRELTAAAQEDRVPENARALQTRWDSVIIARAALQGIAVAALCAVLALP